MTDSDQASASRPESPPIRSVFVTGANGFIGRALMDHFRDAGASVAGVDTVPDRDRGVVAGDINDPSSWRQAIRGSQVVIHTAAIVSNNIDAETAWRVNVIGTQTVLDEAAHAGAERFVQISTAGVARFAHVHPEAAARFLPGRDLDERWPLMPTGNPYSDTKIAAEHLVLAAHASGGQAVTIIRPSDVYGPGCRPWVLEPLAAMEAGRFILPARGRGLFTPIYVDDLVEGISRSVTTRRAAGHIVHLGGERPVTSLEYFGHLSRMLGESKPPRSAPTPVAVTAAEVARMFARLRGRHTEVGRGVMVMLAKSRGVSNAKAHDLLGWWPRVGLDEGMARVREWLIEERRIRA